MNENLFNVEIIVLNSAT